MRRRFSLPAKLFLICFAFVLGCITLISQLSYRFVQNETRTNDAYYLRQIIDKVDQYLTVNFSSFQTILFSVETSLKANIRNEEGVRRQMRELYELNSGFVNNVYLIRSDLSVIGGSMITHIFDEPLPERRPLFDAAMKNRRETIVSEPYLSAYSGWTVTMARYLHNAPEPFVVAIDLDLNAIGTTLFNINKEEKMNLALFTPSGKLVAGFSDDHSSVDARDRTFSIGGMTAAQILDAGGSAIVLQTDDGKPVSILKRPTSKFNWVILSINDESRLKAALARLKNYYVGLLLAGFVLSLLISFLIAKYIRNPLYELKTKMRRAEQGDFDAAISTNRSDEFGDLSRAFDRMLRQIGDLIRRQEEHGEQQRKLEIQVLQAQINPHFLYNTLGAISNVTRLGQPEKADIVIASLISLLEYGMSDASEKVALRHELQNIADYLAIQNIRYNRNFRLLVEVDEQFCDEPVFRMLLQPLVENSLFHGYNGGRIEGPIYIRAYTEGRFFIVEAADQGAGIPAGKLEHLLKPETSVPEAGRKRIGLSNIHERIRLHYGEQYGLHITSIPNRETRVRALFPANPEKERRHG